MARTLDETFLTIHPRTALWWQQREQCLKCKHLEVVKARGRISGGQWSCRGVGGGGGDNGSTACINAREEGMPCGPDANLFEAAR